MIYIIDNNLSNNNKSDNHQSKIIIGGMIEYLTKLEIEKNLFELLQLTQKHKFKYEKIENDLKNLIITIESHKSTNHNVLN